MTYGFEERIYGFADANGGREPCRLVDKMYPHIWGSPTFLESKQFVDYLLYAQKEMGLLKTIELPERDDEDYKSVMRQGNLRADGVV